MHVLNHMTLTLWILHHFLQYLQFEFWSKLFIGRGKKEKAQQPLCSLLPHVLDLTDFSSQLSPKARGSGRPSSPPHPRRRTALRLPSCKQSCLEQGGEERGSGRRREEGGAWRELTGEPAGSQRQLQPRCPRGQHPPSSPLPCLLLSLPVGFDAFSQFSKSICPPYSAFFQLLLELPQKKWV